MAARAGALDSRGARRDHAGERARRPQALPDDDVGGQQHQAHADAGEIWVCVRRGPVVISRPRPGC